jgi:outer membrane autotransporter protein
LPQLKESESGSEVMRTTTPVSLDASNNLWFKLFKGYETYNYNDELKNHTFGGAVGYDHAVNLTTRVGGLFSYGVTNYSTDNISGDSHDWRVGAYVDHKNGNWDYQGLVSYGRNKYDLDRSINLAGSGLGNSTLNSDYQAKVWDVEAKAKYLIPSTKAKTWQLTPYGKLSYTHTNQDAYSETAGGTLRWLLPAAASLPRTWRAPLITLPGAKSAWSLSAAMISTAAGAAA